MGLEGNCLETRKETAHKILTKTMFEMRAEEEETLSRMINKIENLAKERTRLEKELEITLSEVDSNLSLVALEYQLRHSVQDLEERKEEQMREVCILKF